MKITAEFLRIISIRVPDINKDQNLLKSYYYDIIEKFLPKTEKNIESLKFVFDEVKNFFIVINDNRFIVKYRGIFCSNIEDFEIYLFQNLLSKSAFNMTVDLLPVMITPEDKKKIMHGVNKIKDISRRYHYYEMASTYIYIEDYFVIRITTNNEVYVIDEIQN